MAEDLPSSTHFESHAVRRRAQPADRKLRRLRKLFTPPDQLILYRIATVEVSDNSLRYVNGHAFAVMQSVRVRIALSDRIMRRLAAVSANLPEFESP